MAILIICLYLLLSHYVVVGIHGFRGGEVGAGAQS